MQLEQVLGYHQRTKHRVHAWAPGPRGLDWDRQPGPFRKFEGAPRVLLPLGADALTGSFAQLRAAAPSPALPVELGSLAQLFELSFAISAWKELGAARWALRCNPSSGNLHPTEAYLACPELSGLGGGVYHYDAHGHALERRAAVFAPGWSRAFPAGGALVGLTSIHWREAWKYGARAWRYSQLDLGHALGAVRYAAAALGWTARLLATASDEEICRLLGLGRDEDFAGVERERPEALLWVGAEAAVPDVEGLLRWLEGPTWAGRADSPGIDHPDWKDIDEVTEAAAKARTEEPSWEPMALPPLELVPPAPKVPAAAIGCAARPIAGGTRKALAATLIRQRRSALAFDALTRIPAAQLYGMLDALLPRPGVPPCDALPWAPRVHLLVFVHRVKGLPMGLYALARSEAAESGLRAAMREEFIWQPIEGCPDHLRFRLLLPLDLRAQAEQLACRQALAGTGAFAIAFVAEFRASLALGPAWYRRLYLEAGALGQAIYLEAEAAGVRATGIGCFFDDEAHRLLGLADDAFQVLYMQAVGGPVEDQRLMVAS